MSLAHIRFKVELIIFCKAEHIPSNYQQYVSLLSRLFTHSCNRITNAPRETLLEINKTYITKYEGAMINCVSIWRYDIHKWSSSLSCTTTHIKTMLTVQHPPLCQRQLEFYDLSRARPREQRGHDRFTSRPIWGQGVKQWVLFDHLAVSWFTRLCLDSG